jgi:hypothetical protein
MFDTEGTKYHPLFEHLLYSGHGQATMTFAEIEAVLEARLPQSARTREEWWSNSPSGHSQARAWMRAGYKTSRIDLAAQSVTFTLEGWPEGYGRINLFAAAPGTGLAEPGSLALAPGNEAWQTGQEERDHPLFGIWKGKVKLIPGYDYTKPAFEADEPSVD